MTEKKAMLPLLERYRAAFASVLHYPSWQRKCYFGLKVGCLRRHHHPSSLAN